MTGLCEEIHQVWDAVESETVGERCENVGLSKGTLKNAINVYNYNPGSLRCILLGYIGCILLGYIEKPPYLFQCGVFSLDLPVNYISHRPQTNGLHIKSPPPI